MPRKPIVRSREHFYHITARSNNREDFFLAQNVSWIIFENELTKIQKEFGVNISAFVLMKNHFHLLIKTPNEDIDRVMYFLMKRLTNSIQRETGRINKVFGGRYKGSIILDKSYLMNVYKYVYLNPVKAGITKRAEDYIYSTLFYSIKKGPKLSFDIDDLFELKNNKDQFLNWLNQRFSDEENWSIRSGINKTVFEYAKNNSSGKKIFPAHLS
ncbi:MAG: hypothetical protein Fur0010_19480 [Bdellovibrio sp.]